MSNREQDKRPISPQELFSRLMQGNFKQLQCEDEGAKVREQRKILIALIQQYKAQIDKRLFERQEREVYLQKRKKLRAQIQNLRLEREKVQITFDDKMSKVQLNPPEINEQRQCNMQLQEIRGKNHGLGLKIKQMTDYLFKMNQYNNMLEREKKVIQTQVKHVCDGYCCGSSYEERLTKLKRQQEEYEYKLKLKIRQRQENSLLQMQHQQAQIQARNRKRMSSYYSRPTI